MTNTVQNWTEWLRSSRFSYMSDIQIKQTLLWLFKIRDNLLERAKIKHNDIVLDIGTGTGLMAFGAYENLAGTGKVIASDAFSDCVEECKQIAEKIGITSGVEFLVSGAENIELPDNSVDVVLMRSVLVHIQDKKKPFGEIFRVLKNGGRMSVFEPLLRKNTRYCELVNVETFQMYEILKQIEEKIMTNENDSLVNFDEDSLVKIIQESGFLNIDIKISDEVSSYEVLPEMVRPWFEAQPSPGTLSLKEKFLKYLDLTTVENLISSIEKDLSGRTITLHSPVAYIYAEKKFD